MPAVRSPSLCRLHAAAAPPPAAFASLDELQAFVRARLCAVNAWNEDAATLQAVPLVRGGRPCGVLFRASGPKRLTAHAIWATPENRLLIYDTAGRRAEEAAATVRAAA